MLLNGCDSSCRPDIFTSLHFSQFGHPSMESIRLSVFCGIHDVRSVCICIIACQSKLDCSCYSDPLLFFLCPTSSTNYDGGNDCQLEYLDAKRARAYIRKRIGSVNRRTIVDCPDIDFGQRNREAPSSHNKTDARDGLQPRVIRTVLHIMNRLDLIR